MKHSKIISAILSLSIIASQASGFVPNGTAKSESNALTAYAYTENVSGTWIKNNNTGKWWYKHTDGSYTTNDWEKINNVWYHFDKDGWMQTGWLQIGDKWYYLDPSGAMHTGWKEINGKWYFFNPTGYMHTGWKQDKGKWYFLNEDGKMLTGWLRDHDKLYYLGDDGAMLTGWQAIGVYRYHFGEDGAWIPTEEGGNIYAIFTVTAKSGVNVRSSRSTASDSNINGTAVCGKDCIITEIVDGWGYTKGINCTNGKQSGWIYMENMIQGWPCKISASSLNLRKNPGVTDSSNPVLTTIPKDTIVIISDERVYNNDCVWLQTTYNGKKGWICFCDGDRIYCHGVSDCGYDWD